MELAAPNFTIGVDSGHMITLPPPTSDGVTNPYTYIGGTHTSIAGSQTIDRIAIKRSCTLQWTGLSTTQINVILPFVNGVNVGPFLFFDASTSQTYTANVTDLNRAATNPGEWSISFTMVEV